MHGDIIFERLDRGLANDFDNLALTQNNLNQQRRPATVQHQMNSSSGLNHPQTIPQANSLNM